MGCAVWLPFTNNGPVICWKGAVEVGDATGSLDACLCKGQPYYVDIERAQWPKQACQPKQASKYLSGLQ